tara:strand:+ start:387 stop:830 length:444 start_codon:yes stop_codon:yes gene_type:complete
MSDLPPIDISAIPESQREAVLAMLRENKSLKQETTGLQTKTSELEVLIKRLEHLIAELKDATHGKRSEKLREDERQLALKTLRWPSRELRHSKLSRPPQRYGLAKLPGVTVAISPQTFQGLNGWSSLKVWTAPADVARCGTILNFVR